MSNPQQTRPPSGPPYASPYAGPGGLPSLVPDVPVTAVFLAIYLVSAAANMTLLQVNQRRRHRRFLVSGALFGFSMSRAVTCGLRIAWAARAHDVRLAIAANVFVNAGVLVAYVVNLVLAQRVLRAKRPGLGWGDGALKRVVRGAYGGLGIALALVVYASVQAAYTRETERLRVVRHIQSAAVTYLLVFATLPVGLLVLAVAVPKREEEREEEFGEGGMRAKMGINMATACVCVLIAGFKTGVVWESPRLLGHELAWYHSKPAFYVFGFGLEVLVLGIFILGRIDRRFYVPDGSKGPGDYSRGREDGMGREREKEREKEREDREDRAETEESGECRVLDVNNEQ